ncbi:GLO1-Glyoxalase I [Penicillium odoratum]|uniref:GLO1-Glyoxalase I n=1 Tax=Penicillium odoratum TaxID=1167516 RepID=UPI002549AF2F|nr:GLO1-Glyoxalase I [Penicillium odoratum]KAJ5760651.1 GLO1-Glyoxalase I [Penicillium odoratum]
MRIQDPVRSLRFYVELLGMRTVFVMNAGPFTIYYLGYPKTPEHQADPAKFGEETFANLAHTFGLLELYHIHGTENEPAGLYSTGNQPPNLVLGHLGFTVPDVTKTLEYLKLHGAQIEKDLGVATRESIPLSQWEVQRGIGLGSVHPAYQKIFEQIAFVRDPVGLTPVFIEKNFGTVIPLSLCRKT